MRRFFAGGALLLCLSGSLFCNSGCTPAGATTNPNSGPPKVTGAHPAQRPITDEDEYTGWLRASQTQNVQSRVRGHIKDVLFEDGQLVKTGDPLFQLDPQPFQTQINESVANTNASRAEQVAAEKEFARNQELFKRNAVSLQELEKSQADAEALKARTAATEKVTERFQLDLAYATIRAEIDGRVDRAQLTKGNLVSAGGADPVLTTIVAIDPMYAYFTIDERSLQKYRKLHHVGEDAGPQKTVKELNITFRFGLDSDEGLPRTGLLDFAQNKVDSGTGTNEVRGSVANPNAELIAGSRIRVRVPVGAPYEAIVIPDTAVLSDLDKRYVLIIGPGNKVLRRDIVPGRLLDDGQRIVLPAAGGKVALSATDWIITLGLQRARINYEVEAFTADGQPIKVAAAAAN